MGAIVVYESLWGNTAAIAHAIADGLGKDARALSTAEAAPELVRDATLVVAGCPIHAMNLPTQQSRESTVAKPLGPDKLAADLSHPPMREWLETIPSGFGAAAAFDTGIAGPLGRGGASRILKKLERAGYEAVAKHESFRVAAKASNSERGGLLRDGEIARARAWGASLAKAAAT